MPSYIFIGKAGKHNPSTQRHSQENTSAFPLLHDLPLFVFPFGFSLPSGPLQQSLVSVFLYKSLILLSSAE
jgi:hypothetical protein